MCEVERSADDVGQTVVSARGLVAEALQHVGFRDVSYEGVVVIYLADLLQHVLVVLIARRCIQPQQQCIIHSLLIVLLYFPQFGPPFVFYFLGFPFVAGLSRSSNNFPADWISESKPPVRRRGAFNVITFEE
jgi:hypothetical protein